MKTPMQELIETIKKLQKDDDVQPFMWHEQIIKLAESMLEKEKEVMCEFQDLAQRSDFWVEYDGAEGCFDKTFKTKEK